MNTPKPTWAQLIAQGVHRCCATFTGGKQCRRRAQAGADGMTIGFYCTRHQWIHQIGRQAKPK